MAVTALPRPPGSGPFSQNPSEFSALFPPIIDIQTHEAITNRAAAAHAGHAPPAFTVPHLVSPEPSFALPDLDGDAQGHERVLATLDHGSANDFGNEEDAISAQLREDLPRTATPDRGHSSGASSPSITTPTRFQNIWQLAAQPEEDGERAFELNDWESPRMSPPFQKTGPRCAFEELKVISTPSIQLPQLQTPAAVPATDAGSLLDILVRTTLHAPPPGLRWSSSKARFVYDKRRGERAVGAGFVDEILSIATAMRRIEITVEDYAAVKLTSTHKALLAALSDVLEHVKQQVSDLQGKSTASEQTWLARSLALEDVGLLGKALCDVICWPLSEQRPVGFPARPSSLLTHVHSHLFKHMQNLVLRGKEVALCLAYLLQHSSRPIFALLEQWIGVADSWRTDEDVSEESQPWEDLGITRSPMPPVNGELRWDYTFSSRRMPAFIPLDNRRVFFEAGRSLRALRDASSGLHPLCGTDWSIRASWGWGRVDNDPAYDLRLHARQVQRQIDLWRNATMGPDQPRSRTLSMVSASGFRRRRGRQLSVPTTSRAATPAQPSPGLALDDTWSTAMQGPEAHNRATQTPRNHNTSELWKSSPDDLEYFLKRHSDPSDPLLPRDSPTLGAYISTYLLAPLLAHARLISRALVSHYLDDLHFMDHLEVLRAFWLGGDSEFSERVSGALFGKDGGEAGDDVGMGRRARTRARMGIPGAEGSRITSGSVSTLLTPAPSVLETPASAHSLSSSTATPAQWGIGLGVGLSDRRRWPPGGAELAYALRTTLLDQDVGRFSSRGSVWTRIEDRVSFALRALPENEHDERRAKWLDPQAIEALDFLYLAYSPPSSISPILPPAIMDKYQVVHNLLLRFSRVEGVLRGLYFDILRPEAAGSGVGLRGPGGMKVGVDSHIYKPASTIGVPTVAPDMLGVFPPKSETARTLLYLRFIMSWFVTAMSRYVLDTARHNFDVMQHRLGSLRRRPQVTRPQSTVGSREPSQPATPAGVFFDEEAYELLDVLEDETEDGDADDVDPDDGQAQLAAISQLQSANSLVIYHHIILNRILRASLLSAGSVAAFETLMLLLSLVLDLGKAVKDMQRGIITPEAGEQLVKDVRVEWEGTYADFIKSIERLAKTTPELEKKEKPDGQIGGQDDMLLLLGDDGIESRTDLRELLLRLRLYVGPAWRPGVVENAASAVPKEKPTGGGTREKKATANKLSEVGQGREARSEDTEAEAGADEDTAQTEPETGREAPDERPAMQRIVPALGASFQKPAPARVASLADEGSEHRSDDEISID